MDADPLHALLRGRWSPRVFSDGEVSPAEVDALLEAARWAPSAGNSQPWSFIAGRRGDDVHGRLVKHLAASSASWAPAAGLLVANVCHRYVEGTDWEFSDFAMYDLQQLAIWVDRFFKLFCRNQWKRERYAPSFHLDDENLDPRSWCRFPILSGGYQRELKEMWEWAKANAP